MGGFDEIGATQSFPFCGWPLSIWQPPNAKTIALHAWLRIIHLMFGMHDAGNQIRSRRGLKPAGQDTRPPVVKWGRVRRAADGPAPKAFHYNCSLSLTNSPHSPKQRQWTIIFTTHF